MLTTALGDWKQVGLQSQVTHPVSLAWDVVFQHPGLWSLLWEGGAVYAKAIIAMSGPINHRSDHQHKPVPLPLTATNLHIDSVDVMTGTTPIYVMGKLRCGE